MLGGGASGEPTQPCWVHIKQMNWGLRVTDPWPRMSQNFGESTEWFLLKTATMSLEKNKTKRIHLYISVLHKIVTIFILSFWLKKWFKIKTLFCSWKTRQQNLNSPEAPKSNWLNTCLRWATEIGQCSPPQCQPKSNTVTLRPAKHTKLFNSYHVSFAHSNR